MNASWLAAAVALLPPLALAVIYCGRGAIGRRLVAVQLATAISTPLLVALSFAFDQPSSIDLALSLALLSLPGTMLLALFAERWL